MVNNPSWSLIIKVLVVSFAMMMLMILPHKIMAQSQDYDLTYLCSEDSQSTFVVENNTNQNLPAQEAYIEVDGQTLPVEQVFANGDTFVYPAIVEGQVDLYVGDSFVDSATATNEPCEVTNNQYNGANQYGSNGNEGATDAVSSSEASQYSEGHDTPNNSSQSSTEANRGVSANSSNIDRLPDTSGAAFWTLGAGVLLLSGGILLKKLM